MVGQMDVALEAALERGEQVWNTEQLREEFEVTAFLAPFVQVRRKADGVVGVMTFLHSPRYYWGFEAEDE
jgi:hypothetical protein